MALPIGSESRRGIPTTYAGTRFRSRLEGRWAAFFDLIGWRWIYEPFDTANWIPDFLVQGDAPFLVEVGACELWSDYSAKAAKPLAAYPPINVYCERIAHESCRHGDDYIIGDAPERVTLVVGTLPIVDSPHGTAAGLLTTNGREAGTTHGIWARCWVCGELAVVPASGPTGHFPCGHWGTPQPPSDPDLLRLWNQAANPVQWQPRRHR